MTSSTSVLNAVFHAKKVSENFSNKYKTSHPKLSRKGLRSLVAYNIKDVRKTHKITVCSKDSNLLIISTYNGFYLMKEGKHVSPLEAVDCPVKRKFVMLQGQTLMNGKDNRVLFENEKLLDRNTVITTSDFYNWLSNNDDSLSSNFIHDVLEYLESLGFKFFNHKTNKLKVLKLIHQQYFFNKYK